LLPPSRSNAGPGPEIADGTNGAAGGGRADRERCRGA